MKVETARYSRPRHSATVEIYRTRSGKYTVVVTTRRPVAEEIIRLLNGAVDFEVTESRRGIMLKARGLREAGAIYVKLAAAVAVQNARAGRRRARVAAPAYS